MKQFSGIEKGLVILLCGFWYFVLVAWAYRFLSLISEGLASLVVFIAIIIFIKYVFFNE